MCLRGVNPYVDAALTDWSRRGGGSAPMVPRSAAPAAALPEPDSLAGVISGNMTTAYQGASLILLLDCRHICVVVRGIPETLALC